MFLGSLIKNLAPILHFVTSVPRYTKEVSTFAKIEFLILDHKYSIIMALRDPEMREYVNWLKLMS